MPAPRSRADQPYAENIAPYGKVYHTSSPETEMRLLNDEHALMWQTHPRTKSSDGYPDAVKDKPHFLSDRFAGASFQSLPVDQSQKRLCEARCLSLLDDMNNWAGPKYLIAEGDTYTKSPEDETYPQLDVNYVKLDRLPKFSDGWMPVLDALRAGNFFVTSGEVLLHDYSIQGTGAKRTFVADVDWTWPARIRRAGLGRRQDHRPRNRIRDVAGAVLHAITTAFRSMPPARNGCVSRRGIPRAMGRSPSQCI